MKLKIFFAVFVLIIASCEDGRSRFTISGAHEKDWIIYRMDQKTYKKPLYSYRFKQNGDCLYLFYYKDPKTGSIKTAKYDFGDVEYPEKWFIKGDSLNIMGRKYLLTLLSKKQMVIVNIYNHKDSIYLKSF